MNETKIPYLLSDRGEHIAEKGRGGFLLLHSTGELREFAGGKDNDESNGPELGQYQICGDGYSRGS